MMASLRDWLALGDRPGANRSRAPGPDELTSRLFLLWGRGRRRSCSRSCLRNG